MKRMRFVFAAIMLVTLVGQALLAQNADSRMSFFITSVGPGNGADLGGVAGADAHCRTLASAVGTGNRIWRAYLSTSDSSETGTIAGTSARDRIGKGPWYNSKGVMVSRDVDDLHSDSNNLTKQTQLNEKGEVVNGRGDSPNRHDILTGSVLGGTLYPGGPATATCGNWTSSGEGSARVGHHDRNGGGEHPSSWNSAHNSRGCSQENLRGSGGDGLFYCFAIN